MTGALTIDRARFLLLATALAGATACVVEDDEGATGGTAGVTNSGGDSNAGGQNAGGQNAGGT
jgi:hypothetical protein